jgi:hypothetical protein
MTGSPPAHGPLVQVCPCGRVGRSCAAASGLSYQQRAQPLVIGGVVSIGFFVLLRFAVHFGNGGRLRRKKETEE